MGTTSMGRLIVAVTVLVGALAFGTVALAQNKCDAGKLKCVAKKKACLLNVEGKALKKGIPVDSAKRQKCLDKFDGGAVPAKGCIAKLEAKEDLTKPETICSVTGDTASLEATVDAFVDDILTDLVLDYPLVEPPNKCHAALSKCVTKKCKCILKLREKAIKKGLPVDPVKLQKCFDKFFDPLFMKGCVDKVYAKQDPAKPETLCDVPGDGASLEAKIDAFVDGIVAAISPGGPTPTPGGPTPTPGGPTQTPTPGGPTPTPTPGGACPSTLQLDGGSGAAVDHDLGVSGLGHDFTGPLLGRMTLGVSGCAGASPACGECALAGPIANVTGHDNQRCSCDSSVTCTADSDCPGACPCRFFLGPPQPVGVGGVGVCLTQEITGAVTGTTNVDTGSTAFSLPVDTMIYTGPAVDLPCAFCQGDGTPNDGVRGGTCDAGPRVGLTCDANASSTLFANDVSFDCPLSFPLGMLPATWPVATGTTTITVKPSGPPCTSFGFGGSTCMCDTCATAAGEPCNADSDCPAAITCGGLRCLFGAATGTPCTFAGPDPLCLGAFCGVPGEPTKPNGCISTTCTPVGGNEGECLATFNSFCSPVETFRGCLVDSDCPFLGDTCDLFNLECFTDNGVIGGSVAVDGVASVASPVLGALACHGATSSSAANSTLGLPGLGRVRIPTTATLF